MGASAYSNQEKQNELLGKAAKLSVQGQKALASDEARKAFSGQLPILKELEQRIGRLTQASAELNKANAIGKVAPGLLQEIGLLNVLYKELLQAGAGTDEFRQKQEELIDTLDRIDAQVEGGGTGIEQAFDPQIIEDQANQVSSGMGKLFENVFSDLGRRFVATLQFALSAALIFGVQRFLREFLQTAIEVERAFADIETAIALDIEAPRGTVEFRRQVELVRQEVLLLAQDLNVLPTEANEAAFKMVARFDDVGNAMIALRAQLLATKVSTIDQSEVLRALTAVAEGFASSVLEGASTLSLQDRLLQRETVAARGYTEALDLAVHIQQKFGIEVEDTLEGTARATAVFRQMGFTLAQTQALVASVSRTLGQTGAQSSEKLVRSLGQLTDPKIRNALLDLAVNTDSFALHISDFESGAKAWEKIANQFDRIGAADPQAAQQILQIIGQRREVEAVAAALGTADLQQSIVGGALQSLGAAEERFAFLEQTVSEVLKSIAVGFQELAQNFERLGGLTSVKLFLKTLDEILIFLNSSLKLVIDLFDWFDSLFNLNISGWVRNIISMAASLALALKVAKELQKTFLLLTGTSLGGRLVQILSTFFAASGGAAALQGPALGNQRLRTNLVVPSRGIAGARAGLGRLAAASGVTATGLAVFAAAAAVVVLSFKALAEKTQALNDSFETTRADLRLAREQTRRSLREGGIDPESAEGRERIAQDQINSLIASRAEAVSALPSFLEQFGAELSDALIIPTLFADQREKAGTIGQRGTLLDIRQDTPELIPGSTEFIDAKIVALDKQLVEAYAQAFREQLNEVELTPQDLAKGERRFAGRVGHRTPLEDQADFVDEFYAGIARAMADINDTTGTVDEQLARNTNAKAEIARLVNEFETQMSRMGKLPSTLIGTVQTIQRELAQIGTDVELGRISPEFGRQLTEEAIIALKQAVADLQKPGVGSPAEIAAGLAALDAALINLVQGDIDLVAEILNTDRHKRTDLQQLELELQLLLQQAFEANAGSQEQKDATRGISDAMHAIALTQQQLVVDEAERQLRLAEGFQARQEASRNLSEAYRDLAIFWRNIQREDKVQEELDKRLLETRKRREEFADQLAKSTVAKVLIAGPALSPSTKLEAQAVRLNQELKEALKGGRGGEFGTADEIRQQLRETAAQQAQLELRKTIAAARARASTRDALEEQGIALGALVAEQRLVAKIIGRNSEEWFNLERAVKDARSQLFDMVLELEAINRVLGTDITNPLAQAEAAFVEASRQLQLINQEGGGELEQARGQLEVDQAEASLERARFDVALFKLKFLTETGELGTGGYIRALRELLSQVDTSTFQGMQIWSEINSLIEGMTDDLSSMAFNIPGAIRLPTLFEIRRAVEADSMGVNYVDNRQIDVRVNVETVADLGELLQVLSTSLQQTIPLEAQTLATGNSGLTVGPF